MNETRQEIVAGLSHLIASNMQLYNSEYCDPQSSGDEMDDKLTLYKKKVLQYRALREAFENIAYTHDGIQADIPK